MLVLLYLSAADASAAKLLDPAFASALCTAWNASKLPALLGRNGSGWIDSADSEGKQKMVISRRDCADWPKVQLVIEVDAGGAASCTSGGAYDGGGYQWKFEPTTSQWADFTDGFGVMQMPGIMKGFVGPYGTAMNNIGSFGMFFAATGKLALESSASWACTGGDPDEINRAVAGIDKAKMATILE